jgi:signal transduction histidine kinase
MPRRSHRLYFRIYLALLASLAIAAALVALAWHLTADNERRSNHFGAMAELAADALPPTTSDAEAQRNALMRWAARADVDLALYAAGGIKIAGTGNVRPRIDPLASRSGWAYEHPGPPAFLLKLPDGRWLVAQPRHHGRHLPFGFLAVLAMIALAVGIGAYPVVRRLTWRLERLQTSVEALGAGNLGARVRVEGHDEVARLAESFNRSAAHIEALVQSQKSLLANASHELRSPLARIRMAISMLQQQADPKVQLELERNIEELDHLIEEILLASRLDAASSEPLPSEQVDFTALVAEECAREGIELEGDLVTVFGDARLLRRLVRNLLDNAKRHGLGSPIDVTLRRTDDGAAQLSFCDRGPGVAEGERERIFEPFYRAGGTSERTGGIGLGLALVRQIAVKHGGRVRCVTRPGGGSCFEITLPSLPAQSSRQ